VASAIDWFKTVAASGVSVCCIVIKSALISKKLFSTRSFFFLVVVSSPFVYLIKKKPLHKELLGPATRYLKGSRKNAEEKSCLIR
jgi:hypothetical protein